MTAKCEKPGRRDNVCKLDDTQNRVLDDAVLQESSPGLPYHVSQLSKRKLRMTC
jgi:hypothetical protein